MSLGEFGCIGCVWVTLGDFGCVWVCLGEFGCASVVGEFGCVWVYLGSLILPDSRTSFQFARRVWTHSIDKR